MQETIPRVDADAMADSRDLKSMYGDLWKPGLIATKIRCCKNIVDPDIEKTIFIEDNEYEVYNDDGLYLFVESEIVPCLIFKNDCDFKIIEEREG
jgi:hypothetical protein